MRVDAEPAFVLHTRPFRESSQLVDLLTRNHGRIRVVSRGSRSSKRTARLSPFTPLSADWGGRSDLKTLYRAEVDGHAALLQGEYLFVGLYLNELLMCILPEQDPHPVIFDLYIGLLPQLADGVEMEPMLRHFELSLLEELGYGLVLDTDAGDGEPVESETQYLFTPEEGLQRNYDRRTADRRALFNGTELLAMAVSDYSRPEVRRSAKRLLRLALQPHLGNKPLRSRELFVRAK